MAKLSHWIERQLIRTRLIILVAVVASVLMAFAMVVVASIEAILAMKGTVHLFTGDRSEREELFGGEIIGMVLQAFDGYLIAATLLIFAVGLYQAFVGPIAREPGHERVGLLEIATMDQLKNRLSSAILLVLIVRFFRHAVTMEPHSITELAWLSVAIGIVGSMIALLQIGLRKAETKP